MGSIKSATPSKEHSTLTTNMNINTLNTPAFVGIGKTFLVLFGRKINETLSNPLKSVIHLIQFRGPRLLRQVIALGTNR
jgi:hypothetical protein